MIRKNRVYKLSGDVNALDYGARYFQADSKISDPLVIFTVWELVNMPDVCGSDAGTTYMVIEYRLDLSDLNDRDKMQPIFESCGYEDLSFDEFMSESQLLLRLDSAVGYGLGRDESRSGNNAAKLLGFNPSTKNRATL